MNGFIVNGDSVIKFENQRKGKLSDGRGRICRNVADGNAVPFCGFDIYYIISRCKNSDIFELRKLRDYLIVEYDFVIKNYIGVLASFKYFVMRCSVIYAKLAELFKVFPTEITRV